jgi:hypothetical protein
MCQAIAPRALLHGRSTDNVCPDGSTLRRLALPDALVAEKPKVAGLAKYERCYDIASCRKISRMVEQYVMQLRAVFVRFPKDT